MSRHTSALASLIRQRILTGVHMGTLKPGDRLPSVRVVARQHQADVRAALGAYRALEREKLVEVRPRSGVVVAASLRSSASSLPLVGRWLVDFLTLGLARGITPAELREQARQVLDGAAVKAACVECNLDQIHALCTELERDYLIRSSGVEVDALGSAEAARTLAAADIVVTTSFHEEALRAVLPSVAPPLIVVSLSASFRAELARVLAVEPLYFLCTDPRFAAKLVRMFEGRGDVRPVVLGRDDVRGLPPDARIEAMPRALERLPAGWRPRRLMPAPRVFSIETARELVAHLVRIALCATAAAGGAAASAPARAVADAGWAEP